MHHLIETADPKASHSLCFYSTVSLVDRNQVFFEGRFDDDLAEDLGFIESSEYYLNEDIGVSEQVNTNATTMNAAVDDASAEIFATATTIDINASTNTTTTIATTTTTTTTTTDSRLNDTSQPVGN